MTLCHLGLGSNLAHPQRQLHRALTYLKKMPYSHLKTISKFYLSDPQGIKAQPRYYNLVAALDTALCATELLKYCQHIEQKLHRRRRLHWGARTIDIDILLYGREKINTPFLKVPHPYMLERDFVLIPLLEINPNLSLPSGEAISTYLEHCKPRILSTQTSA